MNFKKLIVEVEPIFGILSKKFELPNTISQALTDQFSQLQKGRRKLKNNQCQKVK
jgi:hypothetical protein